jgi:signal transduction histidine kinase
MVRCSSGHLVLAWSHNENNMDSLTVIKRSPAVFAVACVAAALILVVSEASYSRAVHTLDQLETYAVARTHLRDVRLDLLDAETGQRGYLLTGSRSYLQPYEKALSAIDASFTRLQNHYGTDAAPKKLLERLHQEAQGKLEEMARTIALHDSGQSAAALDMVMSNQGKAQMDAIRDITAELLTLEAARIADDRANLYNSLLISRLGLAALSMMSLLALFLFLRQNFWLKQQQLELKRIVQMERDQLGVLVEERTTELTELAQHLQTAREDERARLARNLHDDLGALLTAAKLDAARIRRRLVDASPETMERLDHLVLTLNSSVALGRDIIEDLRPSTLSNLGLVTTLEILARDFAERSGVQVVCQAEPVDLGPVAELVVYRMVQEAITNISKYAQARHVWISMDSAQGMASVHVTDDGIGFDMTTGARAAYGLVGMHYRVAAARGTLSVVSAPGEGTRLSLLLPLAAS